MMSFLQILLALALSSPIPPRTISKPLPPLKARAVFSTELFKDRSIIKNTLNADEQMPLASLTKLMTAITLYERGINFDAPVTFNVSDRREGAIPYLIPGEIITMRDLWNLMLIASSNDAATALVRTTSLTESAFTDTMNEQAKKFGLTQTHFVDPTGLDPKNISTAREVAALARVAFSIPEIRDTTQKSIYYLTIKNKKPRLIKNTNLFTGNTPNNKSFVILGGKTGHIEESGYHLALLTEPPNLSTDCPIFLSVLLGAPTNDDRFSQMQKLLSCIKPE